MRHQHDVPMNSCTWRVHLRTNIYLLMKDMLWTSVFAVSYEEPLSSLIASYDKQRVLTTSPNYTFFRSQCMAKQFDSRSQNKAGEPKQQNYLCWVNLWYVLEHRFGYWAHNFFLNILNAQFKIVAEHNTNTTTVWSVWTKNTFVPPLCFHKGFKSTSIKCVSCRL